MPNAKALRERLLTATLDLVARRGSRGATTRAIAEAAGVNELTLFRQFHSKDTLIREALKWHATHAPTPRLPEEPRNPRVELTAWAREHYRDLLHSRSIIRTTVGEFDGHPEISSWVQQATDPLAKDLTAYLERSRALGLAHGGWDAQAAAAMLIGTLFGDALWRDITPQRFLYAGTAAPEMYVTLFLRAIGAQAGRGVETESAIAAL
jgi:AcrR family transcriptional regulator